MHPSRDGTGVAIFLTSNVQSPTSAVAHTQPSPARAAPAPRPRPSLVIQTSFLGDVILTTPLLAELAIRGPVDVLTIPATAAALANHPAVRTVITYDKHREARGMGALWRTSQELKGRYSLGGPSLLTELIRRERDEETPVAYLAQGSVRSGMLAVLAGFRERIGFNTSAARALYTRRVPYRADRHHAERLWSLAARSPNERLSADALRPRLYPSAQDERRADELLQRAGHRGERLVALAPGSAWGTKRWPFYPELADRLVRQDWRPVIIGSERDRSAAGAITAAVGPRGSVIDATGALPLLATAALIGRAGAIVANDSAPQHLAAAMGTPTVTIYGPTVPELGFGPLAPRHEIAANQDLPCRPCDRHGPARCPLGHWRCMRDLPATTVMDLVRSVTAYLPQS